MMLGINRKLSRGHGTIGVLVFLLIASASLRVVGSASAVIAETSPAETESGTAKIEPMETEQLSEHELESILASFSQREAELEEKEIAIAKRMKALSVADAKVSEKLEQLSAAEESLKATLALASTAAEDDLKHVTDMFEKMKPAVAAQAFQEMDPEFAAGFIGRMNPDAAAAILAGMTPGAVYGVTAILAGRNADVSKQ